MALSSRVKVELPKTGLIIRRNGRYRYVYKVLKAYRNDKGQPTNDRRLIGRMDEKSGMLVPNDNYWELCTQSSVEVLPSFDAVRSAGTVFVLGQVLDTLGVQEILDSTLGPERANLVRNTAIYMTCKGNVMEGLLDWCEQHTVFGKALSSQSSSVLFSSITHDERKAFFRAWASQQVTPQYLSYDVTSFSTYAKAIGDAEWGYNRDGNRLPQINLGCYLGQESGLPVFYVTYPGSIVNKSHLPYMMVYNAELGIKDTTFVMDKGFCSTSNIGYLHDHHLPYIISVDASHKATRSAVDLVRPDIVTMRRHIGAGIYAGCVRARFYGQPSVMHVFFDPTLAEQQRIDHYRTVEVYEETLSQLAQLTKREAKRYSDYFDIVLKEDGSFTFGRNYTKIDTAAGNAGFFCLLTSTELSSTEILSVYRRRDVIEKGFDNLKNHLDMKRLRTHNADTTEGKLFVAFIALIVVAQIEVKLGHFMREKSMSKDMLISELDKIKVIFASDDRRLMNPLTKTQRLILEAMGLTPDDLTAFVLR